MFTAIVDSREQEQYYWPLALSNGDVIPTEVGTLTTGDYSIKGLEHVIAIERKSKNDLLSCIGQGRERFERELMRLLAFPTKALVVEATWRELENGSYRQRLSVNAVMGSLMGWIAMGIPVVMATDHKTASKYCSHIMAITYNRRIKENKNLIGGDTVGKRKSRASAGGATSNRPTSNGKRQTRA